MVHRWVKAGAPLSEGVRLFSLMAGEEHPFLKLIRHNNQICYPILVSELCRRAGINPEGINKDVKFRDMWPFLSMPDCPPELKILAANKITAYHNYASAHEKLFDCNNQGEQFSTVKVLVENYIENTDITREFTYYREHGHCLGKHRIFKEMDALRGLRRLSAIDLMEYKSKLENNIWRTTDLLKKKDKPHLQVEREQRLQRQKNELAEVDRLIESFR